MADLSNKPYSAETLPPSPVTIAPALPPPRVPRLIIQTEPIALPKKFKLFPTDGGKTPTLRTRKACPLG